MKIKLIMIFAFLLGMLGTTTLKAKDGASRELSMAETFPDTSTWVLSRIGGSKARQHTGSKVFITIDKKDSKVSGYTTCNYVRGQFAVGDTVISFSGLTLGKRVCDEATTELEKKLQEALAQANSWKIESNMLLLYDKGVLILEFKNAIGR